MKNRMFTNLRTAVRLAAVCALGATLFGCGSDSKSDDVISGGVSIDSGIVAMENWEVAGVSQKGPFVKGATVTIQELDGITMGQTGKSFKGDIKSDKGDFSIKKIDLVSQYAMLEANGYYRDEISGKKSSGPVTLKAITDLSNRKTVNINLLTHLEYDRVMNLIEDEEMSITSAKAQAEKEIFEAFGIEGEFVESEDLDISKSGDGNAALLAISVLMQSDVDVAGLTERMASFGDAFAEKGTWNDDDMKTAIADWASEADISGKYSEIRKNVEGWKLGEEVPEFEKYVRKFWWENYNLGECDKKREGEIGKVKNEKSKNYYEKSNVRYICEDGNWKKAGDFEKDTYGWKAGEVGEIKAGDVNDDINYIYDGERWREATEVEVLVDGICLESNEGEVAKVENKESEYYYEKSKVRYICEEGNWRIASDIEKDVDGWKAGEVGEIKAGDVNDDINYIYDGEKWREATEVEVLVDGICLESNEGEVAKVENKESEYYYEKSKVRYICEDGNWKKAGDFEKDTYGWKAGEVGEIRAGDVNDDINYIYDGEKWREATEVEVLVDGICLESNEGEVAKVENKESEYYYEKSKVRYICEDGNWKKAGDFEKDTYGWKAGEVGEIRAGDVNDGINYIYDGEKWREASDVEILVGDICLESKEGEIKKDYVCKKETWTEATDYDYDIEGVECVEGETVVGKKTFMQYVCREGEFVEPYKMRTWFGGRGSAQIHHSLVKNSSTYWYFVTDVYDGLKSKIEWLDGAEDGGSEASLKRCNGICGKVVFDDSKEGNIIPYAALAFDFDIHGHEYDASELDGLCVAYSASDKITLKMNFSDSHADDVGHALPEYVLPASAEVSVKRIPWASFVAPDWYKGDTEDYGVNGAKSLAGISVQFDRDESSMMTFNIKAIGPYNGNCEDYVKFENK